MFHKPSPAVSPEKPAVAQQREHQSGVDQRGGKADRGQPLRQFAVRGTDQSRAAFRLEARIVIVLALSVAAISFLISAWAGLGGSLLLVPMLSLLLGPKEGVAVAALLLGINNLSKTIAYRSAIPFRAAMWVLVMNAIGAAFGASMLVAAPDDWVAIAIIAVFAATFVTERIQVTRMNRVAAPVLAMFAGATSGFSGTSGPLKGIALRTLQLDRLHFVGAASVVSLVGDLTKATIFAEASLLDATSWPVVVAAIPLMALTTLIGRRLNRTMGEHVHNALFWTVMGGYTFRLLLA